MMSAKPLDAFLIYQNRPMFMLGIAQVVAINYNPEIKFLIPHSDFHINIFTFSFEEFRCADKYGYQVYYLHKPVC